MSHHRMERQLQDYQHLRINGGGIAISEAIKQAANRSKEMSEQLEKSTTEVF